MGAFRGVGDSADGIDSLGFTGGGDGFYHSLFSAPLHGCGDILQDDVMWEGATATYNCQ